MGAPAEARIAYLPTYLLTYFTYLLAVPWYVGWERLVNNGRLGTASGTRVEGDVVMWRDEMIRR